MSTATQAETSIAAQAVRVSLHKPAARPNEEHMMDAQRAPQHAHTPSGYLALYFPARSQAPSDNCSSFHQTLLATAGPLLTRNK